MTEEEILRLAAQSPKVGLIALRDALRCHGGGYLAAASDSLIHESEGRLSEVLIFSAIDKGLQDLRCIRRLGRSETS